MTAGAPAGRGSRPGSLVSNAGRTLDKPITETAAEDWDAIMAVSARGSFFFFFFAREAFRAMQNRGGGAIVNTGSCAGTVALPEGVAYSASRVLRPS